MKTPGVKREWDLFKFPPFNINPRNERRIHQTHYTEEEVTNSAQDKEEEKEPVLLAEQGGNRSKRSRRRPPQSFSEILKKTKQSKLSQ